MKILIKPCSTVGGAYMVESVGRFGKITKKAIGLTELEAKCLKIRLKSSTR